MGSPPDDGPCEVTITAPDRSWLQAFVRQLVNDRLAAAAHVDMMQTTYRWAEEIHDAGEARATLHTRFSRLPAIASRTTQEHPFDVPCVIAKPITGGVSEYLTWLDEQTH